MITKTKELQRLVEEYRKAGQRWPATKDEIADWAVEKKRYALTAPVLKRLVAEELAQAMSEEYITDAQGRRVRAKHPARVRRNGKQLVLWDDIRTAKRPHMVMAFQMRRRRIASECKQVKIDVDSYNDAHPQEAQIRMVLDFTRDVAEMELGEKTTSSSSAPSRRPRRSPDAVREIISSL
jgi:hypothetical protein